MRALRNFKSNRCYHLISRIANRAFFLTEEERSRFVARMWRVAEFSGIEVLAYCFMGNHLHLLVYLPEARRLDDGELFDRIASLYQGVRLSEIRQEWDTCVRTGDEPGKQSFRERFFRRMYDVSAFMKTLKQNSTMSYNCRSVHTGTMWESRFRSRFPSVCRDHSPQRRYCLAAKGRKVLT
ncbi:MAG: transposase [Kiritimatiellae bacterium]|nr:transposase [Kiritimatiellia bacterium]